MSALNDMLNEFKLLTEVPQLYLANYFSDLRSQVDLVYAKHTPDESDANNIWINLISKIDLFEAFCLEQLEHNALLHKKISNSSSSSNLDVNNLEHQTDELIQHDLFELKKELFANKTVFFLDSTNCKGLNLFNEKPNTKLILLMDEYISDQGIFLLKNSENLEPINNKLTQEFLKLKILQENLKTSNQIDELYLKISNLKQVNLQKDIFNTKQILINSIDNKTFSNLTSLIEVNLTSNSISRIETSTFDGLVNLQDLKLGFNRIDYMDANLFHNLSNLKRLYLNNNKIKELARDQFKGLANLKELYLYSNQISCIDNSMLKYLAKLEVLDMASNRLTHLDVQTFSGLFNLKELDLRYNSLSLSDKKIFSCLPNLKSLYLPSFLAKFYSIKLSPNRNG